MSTLGELKTQVLLALNDPDAQTFDADRQAAILNAAYAEIGRVAPQQFTEDLDPVLSQLSYQVLTDQFPDATPEIEVIRVEVWDGSVTPNIPIYRVMPMAGELGYSQNGYQVWNGQLTLPSYVVTGIDAHIDTYFIRVWGYAPYPVPEDDDTESGLSFEKEQAVILCARIDALRRLNAERDLFKQYQARASVSDVSPAALMSALTQAQEDWRRMKREMMVLRTLPG